MSKKLMIEANDKQFFTYMKNLNLLIEFAKTFKAKISVVEVETENVSSFEEIAAKFCDQNPTVPVSFTLVEVVYPKNKENESSKTRAKMLEDAKLIRSFIKDELMGSGTVSMKELKTKFKSLSVTDACLSNHMTNVRNELAKNNIKVNKAARGVWSKV